MGSHTAIFKAIQAIAQVSSWEVLLENKFSTIRYIRQCEEVKKYASLNSSKEIKSDQELILDFGCGAGQNAIILDELGFKVVGLALEDQASWKYIPATFKVYDGVHFPFEENTFDHIVLFGVLEHVGQDSPTKGREAFIRNQDAR